MRRVRKLMTVVTATVGVIVGGLSVMVAPALAEGPQVVSESAAPKAEEVRLEAVVDPGNEPTECSFRYGETTVSENEVACEQASIEGGEQGVGLTVSGLEQDTNYRYQVVLKNSTGETAGTEKTFTTALRPVAPQTEAAGAITGTTATLKGMLKPAATKLKYEFEYSAGASCEGGATTNEGEGEGKVSMPVTGLEGSSEYAFCLVAINDVGESAVGAPVTFRTLATDPTVVGESSSGVTPFAADLQAEVNPENQSATLCVFEYGEVVIEHRAPCEQATLEGAGPQSATLSLSGLKAATTYRYRVVVENATGKAEGAEEEFTTLTAEAPSITSESIAGLFATGVTFGAQINPNYQATTYTFEYATEEALIGTPAATKVAGIHTLAAESAELPAGVPVNGLTPGETYYYRAAATNATGTSTDPTIGSFTTPVLPLVSAGEAQNITGTTATLSATVNPEGVETTYYFQYVSEARYQAALAEGAGDPYTAGEATAPAGAGSSTEPQTVGPTLATGLRPDTTYHYRVVAHNDFEGKIETSYGQDATFTTTPGTLPTVSTGGANAVSQNSATLTGTVGTNSLQTNYGFEIGTEPGNYGPATGLGSIGGATTEEVHVTLSELQPGTTYYYRVTATNADGATTGQSASFTTPGFPTLITPPASPPQIATPNIAFPKQEKTTTVKPTTTKTLTKAQKLSKALKACHTKKNKTARNKCEKQARHKLTPAQKKK